jgi:hypothetical protein
MDAKRSIPMNDADDYQRRAERVCEAVGVRFVRATTGKGCVYSEPERGAGHLSHAVMLRIEALMLAADRVV